MEAKGGIEFLAYLLVPRKRIDYFDDMADRTSSDLDGIRGGFGREDRVRFWRVGCP